MFCLKMNNADREQLSPGERMDAMRLIDADKLLDEIPTPHYPDEQISRNAAIADHAEIICSAPVAYDVVKVAEQIKKKRAIAFLTIANTGDEKLDEAYKQVSIYLDSVIEIVKKGGIE